MVYCCGAWALDNPVRLQWQTNGGVLVIYPDSLSGIAKPVNNLSDRLWAIKLRAECTPCHFVSISHVNVQILNLTIFCLKYRFYMYIYMYLSTYKYISLIYLLNRKKYLRGGTKLNYRNLVLCLQVSKLNITENNT